MASSQHASSNTRPTGTSSTSRKRMVTYGTSSRKRRSDDVAHALESQSVPSHQQDSFDPLAAPNTSSIKAQSSRPQRLRSNHQEPHSSSPRNNDARKRTHSTAFQADATADSETSSTLNSSVARKDHATPPSPRKPKDRRASFSRTAAPPTLAQASVGRSRASPTISLHPTTDLSSNTKLSDQKNHTHLGREVEGQRQAAQQPVRRHRLIDALAAQRVKSPEAEVSDPASIPGRAFDNFPDDTSHTQSQIIQIDSPSRRIDARGMAAARRKIKFTYGQARSTFSSPRKLEQPVANSHSEDVDIFNLTPGRLSTPPRSPSPMEEEVEEHENSKHAIQSVHELRRAGAKNRFSDEMDDLLSRIGGPGPSPSTMRRNGLCELVHMLQNEEFASQFRDHASRDKIAKDIQGEQDIISAFALSAVLVIFLSSNLAPHLVRQLSDDRVGLWLGGLLATDQDITAIAAQRSANVSKATRASLASVKQTLVQMRIWHNYTVTKLTPRTLALQLLGILIRSTDSQYLLQVVSDSGNDIAHLAESYAHQGSPTDLDFALLISILEIQSSLGTIIGRPMSDVQGRALRAARFLEATLQRWPSKRGDLDAALLKLATNTTNNEMGAAAFNDANLLSNLAICICSGFGLVKGAMGKNRFESLVFDELLLVIGIFINVVEHCADARASAHGKPLESLNALWQDNRNLMTEADSVEKSKLSIALGYLAVLLGYLLLSHLSPEARASVTFPSKGELVASIQEFILMHRSVDSRVHELEGLVGELMRQDQQERREAKRR